MLAGQEQLIAQILECTKRNESVLLIGSSGIGKTHIMDHLYSIYSDAAYIEGLLLSARNAPGESELVLEKRMMTSPHIMWLVDDIDLLVGKKIDFRDPVRFAVKSYFKRLFYPPQMCIATCSDDKDVDDWVLQKFKHQLRIVVSQREQREAIAFDMLKEYPHLPNQSCFVELARDKFGATPMDLEDILTKMYTHKDFDERSLREWFNFSPQALLPYLSDVPKYELHALYGLEREIEVLSASLIEPFKHYALYQKHGVSIPKGIVLHGHTGCGKTHLGIAMVRQAGLNLLVIEATTLRSRYVGETEKRLQQVFESARECAPCVLFFDRLEGLMGERTRESAGSARLVSCFLTELDGIGTKGQANMVLVMGTVERLDMLDPAIIRPGRLGVHVELQAMSNAAKAQLYLEYKTKGYELNDAQVEEVANRTVAWSGAKMRQLYRDAAYHAIRLEKESVEFSDFKFSSP